MASLTIFEENYYKLIAKGKMPGCISKSWKEIWSSKIDRAYKYAFQIYDERSRDWSNAAVGIFIFAN